MAKRKKVHKDKATKTSKGHAWISFIVFVWPFIYLYRQVFPINGKYIPIGQDFEVLYYRFKIYLLAHLEQGTLPLWSPSEAAGFPFFSNPFAQVYYPLNLLLILLCKLLGGYSPIYHQAYTVLGISIFALGLYFWLRLIHRNLRSVVFSVLVMSVSFRMTEILRFPNAIHAAAWYPWILYSITRIFLSKSTKESLLLGGGLVFFIYCLATAGYPYFLYYAQFLFIPYAGLFVIRKLRTKLFAIEEIHWKRSLLTLLSSGMLAILAIFPYLLSIQGLMSETVDRGGDSFDYSTRHLFNCYDTIGSLIYPPNCQWEGIYFFGLTSLLIICMFFFRGLLPVQKLQIPNGPAQKDALSRDRWFCFVLVTWIGIISYISWGRESYLFKLLWHIMPGFSSLRVWGRLNIVLVPLWTWFLCRAYSDLEAFVCSKQNATDVLWRAEKRSRLLVIGVTYFIILSMQFYMYQNNYTDKYWQFGRDFDRYNKLFLIFGAVAFICIVLFLILRSTILKKVKYASLTMFLVLFTITIVEIRPIGSKLWMEPEQNSPNCVRLDFKSITRNSFSRNRLFLNRTISLDSTYYTGTVENWYFERYVDFLERTEKEKKVRDILLGARGAHKIFFSASLKHDTILSFLQDAGHCRNVGHLISYDGDELIWEINAPYQGYLSFIDNWDPYWEVFVDGDQKAIELLFGTFKSVHVPAGNHQVRFVYRPTLKKIFNRTNVDIQGRE